MPTRYYRWYGAIDIPGDAVRDLLTIAVRPCPPRRGATLRAGHHIDALADPSGTRVLRGLTDRAGPVGMRGRVATMACMAVVSVAAVLPTSARAEPIVELAESPSDEPVAVTDGAGTLHVSWRDRTSFSRPVFACRVPAGSAGPCTPVRIADRSAGDPRLLIRASDGVLFVVVQRSVDDTVATWAVASADGGGSWTPPFPLAAGIDDLDDAELTPDGAAVDLVGQGSSGNDLRFQRATLGVPPETRIASLGSASVDTGQVSHLTDGRPIVLAAVTTDAARRSFVPRAGADLRATEAWTGRAERQIGGILTARLDAGPTGAWLLTKATPGQAAAGYSGRLWRHGVGGFALARRVGALNRPVRQPIGLGEADSKIAFDVDLAGRLHAAWTRTRCGGKQVCLVYRRTDRNGFGLPVSYPLGPASQGGSDAVIELTAAANSGGSGWIVWRTTMGRLRAVPMVTPPRGARVGSLRLGRRRVSIPDLYACTPTGGTFRHRLKVDGRRGTRILSVRFFFDGGQPSAVDRRRPWRRDFTLTFAPGTRHVAMAEIVYRMAGSRRTRTARIGRTFVMC